MSELNKKNIDNALRVVQLKLKLGLIGNEVKQFNMSDTLSQFCGLDDHDCGSIGCIGGYADLELGGKGNSVLNYAVEGNRKALEHLFYPHGYGFGAEDNWDRLTPKKAVVAIENYLKGSSDPWKGVAPRNPKY